MCPLIKTDSHDPIFDYYIIIIIINYYYYYYYS